jgi:hypothetical protein
MSFRELSKCDREDISGSLPKFVIDYQTNNIIEEISYSNKKFVAKISKLSENIDKEFSIYNILIDNNVYGFLNYNSFFICNDFFTKIIKENTINIYKKNKKDMSKILVMEYIEDGSFGLYNWSSDDIEIIKSCVKQLICSLVDAYIKTGFVHYGLYNNNYLLKRTRKTELKYNINGKEIIIPLYGLETAIMDLENCKINQNIYEFIYSLNKLIYSIDDISIKNDILGKYSIKITIKINELYILSIDDKTRNIELAMRVLEILDI